MWCPESLLKHSESNQRKGQRSRVCLSVRLFPHECKQHPLLLISHEEVHNNNSSFQKHVVMTYEVENDKRGRNLQNFQKAKAVTHFLYCPHPLPVFLLALTLVALCSTGHHLMSIHGPDLDFCPVDYSKLYCNNGRMSQNFVSKF